MSLSLSRSMTPLYDLNSSLPDLNEEHQHLQFFLSPNYDHSAANSSLYSTQYVASFGDLHHNQEVVDHTTQGQFSTDPKPPPPSSSSSIAFEAGVNPRNELDKRVDDLNHYGIEGSAKWNSSKIMIKSASETDHKPLKYTLRIQDHHPNYSETTTNNNNNNGSRSNSQSIRVCSDCNTTTTPLWRSGPRGPKSLCNACGIRQRKARRAMAAAEGNGTVETKPSKLHNMKEKKMRTGHVNQCKKLCNHSSSLAQKPKISFKNFAFNFTNNKNSSLHPVFPQDVEQAAILLMELSCGFVQG